MVFADLFVLSRSGLEQPSGDGDTPVDEAGRGALMGPVVAAAVKVTAPPLLVTVSD